MTCPRCQHHLIVERLAERDTNALGQTILLARCPLCSYYTDPQMEANRRQAHPEGTRNLRPGFYRLTNQEFRHRVRTAGQKLPGGDKAKYAKLFRKTAE